MSFACLLSVHIKKFYVINPEAYELPSCAVLGREANYNLYVMEFNLIDTFRYIIFRRTIEKADKIKAANRRKLAYLRCVQKDIDKLNKQAKEEINQVGLRRRISR